MEKEISEVSHALLEARSTIEYMRVIDHRQKGAAGLSRNLQFEAEKQIMSAINITVPVWMSKDNPRISVQ